MRHRFAFFAVLGLGTASLAAEPITLQALTSTSLPPHHLLLPSSPALGRGPAPLAAAPTTRHALTPTSGRGAELLLDGDPATGWSPEGDAEDEGVLLRFENPLEIDGVSLRACAGAPTLHAAL